MSESMEYSHHQTRFSPATMDHSWYGSMQRGTTMHGPAPAYTDTAIRRTKSSMPIRLMRRMTQRSHKDMDPGTIPVLSRREQRRAEKKEQRKLDECQAQQRKQYHEMARSRQLELEQSAIRAGQMLPQKKRTVKQKVKDTLRRSTTSAKQKTAANTPSHMHSDLVAETSMQPPHIDAFRSKDELQNWFHPSDVEAGPVIPSNIANTYPAELPAAEVSSPFASSSKSYLQKQLEEPLDIDTLPPPVRSPSPCLSSIPRRGITVSETSLPATTPTTPSSKQMQCDYCHGAIKMTGFHYACLVCNEGDCLYCTNCANEGRTCRHELIERTRNIKRHPTNPQRTERRSLMTDKDKDKSPMNAQECSAQSAELSASLESTSSAYARRHQAALLLKGKEPVQSSPVSLHTSETLFLDFETKRREQEIVFREKEVTLREREAMLREREAWTMSKEREATLMQHLHSSSVLQQRAEVGAQFEPSTPISRHSSFGDRGSRRSLPRQPFQTVSTSDNILVHSADCAKRPNIRNASELVNMTASVGGIEDAAATLRSHGSNNKRKGPTSSTNAGRSTSQRSQNPARRANSNRDSHGHEQGEELGSESDASSPKRRRHESSPEPQKLFACPYFKHDPVRYAEGNTREIHYRGCAGGLFRDISRVKQHLRRTHHYPDFYCRRCFEVFKDNEKLQRHSSLREACERQDCPYPERINETKQTNIHVKRPGKDPKELWLDIYSIIFPGSPQPESPYIEQSQQVPVQSQVLDQFIELFRRNLDTAAHSEPWLATGTPSRAVLDDQLLQTFYHLGGTNTTSAGTPALLVSPVSPRNDLPTHLSSRSSQESSFVAYRTSATSPVAPQALRPALKVSTSYSTRSAVPSNSSSDAIPSHRSSAFPRIAPHIRDDSGYGPEGESWASGDDVRLMFDAQALEPSSATSTRSTKSVSFAPDPNDWTGRDHLEPHVSPIIPYQHISHDAPITSQHSSMSSTTSHQLRKHKRTDSAYGTMSSAQASQSSLNQPQLYLSTDSFAEQGWPSNMNFSTYQQHPQYQHQRQKSYADPPVLFINPAELNVPMSPGISADLQAYLNRNIGATDNGQPTSF